MNLKEKNHVLRLALDNINYIVTQHACSPAENIEKEYDSNAFAFNEIAKVIANTMRLDIAGGDLPKTTYFTPEAARVFAQAQKDIMDGKSLNEIFANPPFKAEDGFARLFHCDEIGLRLQRFKSPQCIRLVGYFQPVPKPGCGETIPDESKHVYEIAVDRDGEGAYTARAYCDRRQTLSVTSTCKWTAEQGAVAALFRKLRHTCRKTRRNIAAARALAGEGK